MATIHLEIVTPERVLWTGEVTEVTAPGSLGEFGTLPDHSPFVTSLDMGPLHIITADGSEQWAAIHGGYFEILDNRATILANRAEMAADIDIDRANSSQKRAEDRLVEFTHMSGDDVEVIRARASLQRALVRNIVGGKNR